MNKYLLTYVAGALLTFLIVSTDPENCGRYDDDICFTAVAEGYFAALFWPLYWPRQTLLALRR